MLCLSRKINERVRIATAAGEIVITVLKVGGNVRLGFEAPKNNAITREPPAVSPPEQWRGDPKTGATATAVQRQRVVDEMKGGRRCKKR